MRLKAIEMQGFKSFPERTRIAFDSGVTAIIGPNGSGKSNISDAMRWVLGEMSVKSLRGNKMEDVIFNGTATRAAANCAQVTLHIDTEEEYNRVGNTTILEDSEENNKKDKLRLSDAPEITVTRKYYRSGESEYYINKKQVRLKDVYELFYDTGIGREGYSVIGQGRISEVLSQKDEERRSIFEEAAGISGFRYKKQEAERKLRDTESNLVRVNDILSEISARIGPLEKEAENAKQYLVLSEEKKGIEITLWLERIDLLRQRRVECETDRSNAARALQEADAEVAKCDAETDRMLDESYEFSRIMSECEHEKTDAVHKRGEAEGRRAVCINEIEHANKAKEENRLALDVAGKELINAEGEKAVLETALEAADTTLKNAEADFAKAEEEYETARAVSAEANGKYLETGDRLEAKTTEKSALAAERAAAEALLAAETRSRSENTERIEAGRERVSLLEADKSGLEEKLASAEKSKSEIEAEIERSEAEINGYAAASDETRKSIASERMLQSGDERHREQLIRMEQLFEGYPDSVKRILSDCAEGKIVSGGSKVTPHGTVSNIISSESEYVVALETALAAAVQFIVVEKESDAKACIAYLKDNRLGRATFLPIESVTGRLADVSAISGMRGYIGIASELAKYDKRFSGVVTDLLGRTVIAESIDCASEIARKSGFRIKIVTLDGQVINPGGSYTGGSPAKKAGVFTRAMDIERLSAEIGKREALIAKLEKKLEKSEEKREECGKAIAVLYEKHKEIAEAVTAIASEVGSAKVRIEEEKSHIAAITASLGDASTLLTRLSETEAALNAATAQADALAALKTEAKSDYEDKKLCEEEAFSKLNEARTELYEHRNGLSVAKERIELCVRRITEIKARIALLNATFTDNDAEIAARTAETGAIAAEIKECDALIAACERKLEAMLTGREEKEKQLNEMRSRQKQAAAVKEEAFRAVTEAEMKCGSVNTEYDNVTNRLWDEYELTYSDASRFRLPKEKMEKASSRLATLKSKIRAMGSINVNAVEEYRVTKERFDFLKEQTDDLNNTRRSLDKQIEKLATGMKETFLECFDKINVEFNSVFTELFGGGSAHAELTDPLMPLECGIDIVLKVPGKSIRSISLLSGGEQSFAAISLYLALQKVNPAPFCIFDEIESALDDVNLAKFASYVRSNSDKTQYILITHRRGTMERADTLYGITMKQKGISDYMKLNMAKLDENIREYTE